jgi:hypothetical protein
MPDGLVVLFRRQGIGIFGWWLGTYLLRAVRDLALGGHSAVTQAVSDLTLFGQYLVSNPRLPWITGEPDAWSEFFWGHPREQDIPRPLPDPVTYLGAAAALLIATEPMTAKILPEEGPQRLTPLHDLHPYIARRWNTGTRGQLPGLPVPAKFQHIFTDWANNKISFVGTKRQRRTQAAHKHAVNI